MCAADITTSQAVGHLSPGEIERMVQVAAQMKADDDKVLDDTFMCNMCVCVCCVLDLPRVGADDKCMLAYMIQGALHVHMRAYTHTRWWRGWRHGRSWSTCSMRARTRLRPAGVHV